MTADDKKRATLNFGNEAETPAVPSVDPSAVKAAARAVGFRDAESAGNIPRLLQDPHDGRGARPDAPNSSRPGCAPKRSRRSMPVPTSIKLRWPRRSSEQWRRFCKVN